MPNEDRDRQARRLFQRALGIEPSEWGTFLDTECRGDDELRHSLVELLSREAQPTSVLVDRASGEAPPDLAPGERLTERYRIERAIGRGGMGVVYAAHDELLDRPVAVKVMAREIFGEAGKQRFLREARAAAALNHPNVVAIYDAGELEGRPFLVMERVEGHSLERHAPAELEDILEVAIGVCEALDHAHGRGLVHRDLKPANVLLAGDRPDRTRVKLTDMGIALARGGPRVTRTGAVAGTPTYMAPEQALGRDVDGRADLYALGVMLYQWATGRPPFEGDDALAIVSQHVNAPVVPPRNRRPGLPASFERVVLRLLAKEPSSRYSSAAEVRAALGTVRQVTGEEAPGSALALSGLLRGRMVGRQRELEQLQARWRAVREGGGHLVLISGEPGVGKTRLVRELVASVGLEGGRILSGGCYENEATTPYLPFVEALRGFVRDAEDEPLRETLGDSAPEIARLAPGIESRLGPFQRSTGLSPQEQRLRLFDHVARVLARLARPHGLLVFLDDLQWADPGSFDLLHDLLRHLRGDAVLFVGTYRDTEVDPSHPLIRATVDWERERLASRLPLERLQRHDTRLMVSTLLGQPEISEELVLDLHRETEGNPFFVEEIVKALVASGGLVRRGEVWTRAATDEVFLPQSLKSAIESRLEKISDPCLRVLRTAAVLGKDFDFGCLASVADQPEDSLLDLLDEAVAAQIVAPGRGESFAFTHDKIREVLYEEINPVRRRRIHRRIAERLLELRESGTEIEVEDLAFHFVAAGDSERGLEFSARAATAARRVFAFDTALDRLEQALACARALQDRDQIVRVLETLGDVASDRGDSGRAAQALEAALELATGEPVRARLHVKAADSYLVSGDRRGREHVEAALAALGPDSEPALIVKAEMTRARVEHLAGRLRDAAEIYRRALELAAAAPEDPALLISLYSNVAGTYQHLAEFPRSNQLARRCIALGERHDLPYGRMLGHEFLAENAYYLGRWEEAVRHNEIEEREALECQAGNRLLWSKFRGFSLHALGRSAEAERVAREAIAMAANTGERRVELLCRFILVEVLLDTGRVEESLALGHEATEAADRAALLNHRITGRAHLSRALARAGRVEEAAAAARTALELALDSESMGLVLIFGSTLALAMLASGATEEAGAILDRHEAIARRTEAAARFAQNRHARGLAAALAGDRKAAMELLGEAVAGLEATQTFPSLAATLLDRAALHADRDAAEADRRRSEELQRRLGLDVAGTL